MWYKSESYNPTWIACRLHLSHPLRPLFGTYMNPNYTPPQQAYLQSMPYHPQRVPQWIIVEQVPYEAQSSRRNISGSVEFKDSQTGRQGILLTNVMLPNYERLLQDPDALVLHENVGQKLSYRLQFEGNELYTKQKYAKTTGREIPVSRSKMARQVAEVVQSFFDERGHVGENGVRFVLVGREHERRRMVRFDELYLMQVDHVTTGSLQPQFATFGYFNTYPQVQPAYAFTGPGAQGQYAQH